MIMTLYIRLTESYKELLISILREPEKGFINEHLKFLFYDSNVCFPYIFVHNKQ